MRVTERAPTPHRDDYPEAILWDNDGVLVETEGLYFRASREVLASVGLELSRADFVEISLRRGASCFELAEEAGFDGHAVAEMRRTRDDRFLELLNAGVTVIDGVRETLAELHGRAPMVIVTSSKTQHFQAIHAQTGLLDYFDFTLCAEDYGRHTPDPEPYETAARRLGVDPGVCIAVEDSERGVSAAVAAGMRCVAVPGWLAAEGDYGAAWRVLETIRHLPSLLELESSAPR